MWNITVELFIVGVSISFGACFFYCSPIILSYVAGVGKGWKDGIKFILIFFFIQLIISTILGFLFGLVGSFMGEAMKEYKQIIFIVVGVIISVIALLMIFGKKNKIFSCCSFVKNHVIDDVVKGAFLLGLVIGVLPCLPFLAVYTYIFFKATNMWHGALWGFSFGLGRFVSPLLPLSVLAGSLPGIIGRSKKISIIFTKICGIILLYMGIKLIFPGLHLIF